MIAMHSISNENQELHLMVTCMASLRCHKWELNQLPYLNNKGWNFSYTDDVIMGLLLFLLFFYGIYIDLAKSGKGVVF